MTVADINDDGKLDLLTSNYTVNAISVMYGNGDGTFQSPGTLAAGTNPSTPVVVADFDPQRIADTRASLPALKHRIL